LIRLTGQWDKGSAGSFPGFGIGSIQSSFQADGKCYVRRTALDDSKRKSIACWGKCCRAIFGIPFRPGGLPTLRHRMVSWISVVLVKRGAFAGSVGIRWQRLVDHLKRFQLRQFAYRQPHCRPGHLLSRSLRERFSSGDQRIWSAKLYHLLNHLPQRLILGTKIFLSTAQMFLHSLVQLVGHRTIEAVNLSFQSEIPSGWPQPPQLFFGRILSWK
jgi:hypothetical protein